MIRNMFRFAQETAKKMPMWKKVLFGIVVTAPPVVAKKAGQKVIDKLFKDRKKSLRQKLEEIKELWDEGHITEEEYQKIRRALLDRAANEA
jgi:alkanesulfonate monooxygenase SsuD/methylene tetrahydromethanopterin reductase-like flavin-dependent oxidoreductase (luciferase family)